MRHTALTRMAPFCDVFTLARTAGLSSITITRLYCHPQADAVEAAITRFGNRSEVVTDGGHRANRRLAQRGESEMKKWPLLFLVLNEWVTCNLLITGQGSQLNGFNDCALDRVGSLRHFEAPLFPEFLMVRLRHTARRAIPARIVERTRARSVTKKGEALRPLLNVSCSNSH
jgi:hypothetical protein